MSRLTAFLPLALGLLVAGCSEHESEPATFSDPALIEALSELPIQDQGRVKPLSTFADFTVLRLNGMRKVRVDLDAKDGAGAPKRQALTPIQWVARCLLFPEKARDDKVFLVAEKKALETLSTLGLEDLDERRRRDRYSYNELVSARRELIDQHELLRPRSGTMDNPQVEAKTLSPLEQQLVSLAENLVLFERLVHALDFARERLEIKGVVGFAFKDAQPKVEGSARYSEAVGYGQNLAKTFFELQRTTPDQISETLKREQMQELNRFTRSAEDLGRSAELLTCFAPPVVAGAEPGPAPWDSPYSLLVTCVKEGSMQHAKQVAALRAFEDLVPVRDDPATLGKRVSALRGALGELAEARGEYSKVPLEVSYYRMDLLYRAQVLFVFGFVLVALTWLVDPKRLASKLLTWGTLGLTTSGLALLIVGITIRCVLRGRPPVTTLYETILFICACGVLTALGLEWVNRQRVGLALAPFLGAVLLFLAYRYELSDAKDTMPQLVAVLDTNFWLSTHVTTVTLGYSAGLLAGVIGHVYLLGRLAHWFSGGRWFSNPATFRNLSKLTYGVIGFGLVFSTVGTILGGIWANDSWGRFWGWDPKENGALLIVLWELAILHGRMGGYLREFGVCYTAAIGTAVVAFSWWGVNLLGVGLHSYGFTGGVAKVLYAYYGLEALFVLAVAATWLGRRFAGRKPLHVKLA
ncbi:MAG: cytochrome c biogenesis protein CcsA [Planctomycetes bacterium]|nr:cytochrome c biogenesis protein CcsA [Planctomycetota bacterium]